jgi:hypothetical protein
MPPVFNTHKEGLIMIYRIYRVSNNQTVQTFADREDAFDAISGLAEDSPRVYGMERIDEFDLHLMKSPDYAQEEATHAVNHLRELLDDGCGLEYLMKRKDKDLKRWKAFFEPESYTEFETHYENEFKRIFGGE